MTRNQYLDQLAAKVSDLPTLPAVVLRVMQMLEDPLCSGADLSRVVASDPALAARVLKLSNSAYYGFRQKISSVPQAVTLLGFATLKNTLLSVAVFDLFRLQQATGFDMPGLWKHSVATATASKLVAKRVRFPNAEKVWTAGLLHDIGKIIIARYLPASLLKVVAAVQTDGLAIYDAELKILGLPHPAFGGWVLDRWGLPTPLVEAVEFHHHPTRAPYSFDMAAIVYLGNILAHRAEIGCGGDHMLREIDPFVLQHFGIGEGEMLEMHDDLLFKRLEIDTFASIAA